MRRLPAVLTAGLIVLFSALPASAASDLYRSRFVVSGADKERSLPGFIACLEDVLVKVSGDPRLIGSSRIAGLQQNAMSFVDAFTYRDLYAGISLHDEQGSYDRPHYLTVDFNPARIDAALAGLGLKPWTGERPKLAVFLAVEKYDKRYIVTGDDPRDKAMGEALAAASTRYGLEATFPPGVVASTIASETLLTANDLAVRAGQAGATLPLVGRLAWSDSEHGWISDWWLASGGARHHWQIRGVNFDEAFRDAIRGGDQILSGNGEPGDIAP